MSKHDMTLPFLALLLGGICLSFSPGDNGDHYPSGYPQNVKPGISADDDSSDRQWSRNPSYRQQKIAYMDERDRDIHRRANRMGDWGFRQNWRYDRRAFYRGETQGEAYEEEHPEYTGGIGMDPDREFLQMRRFYLEESRRRAWENAHRSNPRNSPYASNDQKNQKNQNQSSKNEYANNRLANNDNPQRNGDQRNQNNAPQNKGTNTRPYRPNNLNDHVIADNDFDKNKSNHRSRDDVSKQNTNGNHFNSYSNSDRTPRYYYYYD